MEILLIDDDRMFSEPLTWQLEQEGYNVTYRQHIEDVIDEKGKLKFSPPDCIILDIMMPSRHRYTTGEINAGRDTGFRLLSDIEKGAPNTPVIVITIRLDIDKNLVRKQHKSVRDILTKPVTPAEVIEATKKVMKG
jgi:DNA-binding response OmpR family regulator